MKKRSATLSQDSRVAQADGVNTSTGPFRGHFPQITSFPRCRSSSAAPGRIALIEEG